MSFSDLAKKQSCEACRGGVGAKIDLAFVYEEMKYDLKMIDVSMLCWNGSS